MEDAFPFICVRGMGYPNSPATHLGNVQETGIAAASLGVTTVSPVGRVSQRPVSLRIFVKVRRKEKGILAQVIPISTRIVKHGKPHVEEVSARRRKLHPIGDFVRVQAEVGGLSKQRPLLGC